MRSRVTASCSPARDEMQPQLMASAQRVRCKLVHVRRFVSACVRSWARASERASVRACMRACERASERASERACVRACVRAREQASEQAC
eukprot:3780624-Pleurochrysis_carterae.AAC.1